MVGFELEGKKVKTKEPHVKIPGWWMTNTVCKQTKNKFAFNYSGSDSAEFGKCTGFLGLPACEPRCFQVSSHTGSCKPSFDCRCHRANSLQPRLKDDTSMTPIPTPPFYPNTPLWEDTQSFVSHTITSTFSSSVMPLFSDAASRWGWLHFSLRQGRKWDYSKSFLSFLSLTQLRCLWIQI